MKGLLIITFFFSLNFLYAQERVGNGEGLSEQRITSINEYLPHYINICLSGGCLMSASELELLKSLLLMRENVPKFIFTSEGKVASVFETTKSPSSDVKININGLYTLDQAITLEKALSIVVSIYDYKASRSTNELLIQKLSRALSVAITTAQHSFDYSYMRFSFYKSNEVYGRTVFVNDKKFSFNLGQELFERFKCSDEKSLILQKVYWKDASKGFSLAIEGEAHCSLSGPFKIIVNLNVKNIGISYPTGIFAVELDEEDTILSVLKSN